MKRMSEVFELPIRPQPSESKYFQHLLFDGSGSDEPIGSFNNCQMAMSAMKAINHVDALADALAVCADILGEMEASEYVNDAERAYYQAIEALTAYRGSK